MPPSRRLALLAALVTTTALAAGVAGSAVAHPSGRHRHAPTTTRYALTTKTPYTPQGSARTYQPAPRGFRPVLTENVSRHGARTLSNPDEGNALFALWSAARAQGALTRIGRGLGPEIERLLAANATVGYGLLSQSGKRELFSTAERLERRLPAVFAHAAAGARTGSTRVAVFSSDATRTQQSAAGFVQGLQAARPSLATVIAPDVVDDDLLYFHKAAVNKDYQDYVANDPRVAAAEAEARALPRTDTAARTILERSFTPAFVAEVAAGACSAQFADDVDAAQAVYDLWAVTKDMPDEGRWHMDRYLTRGGAAWFGYLDDVTSFYENGPGFAGDDITYAMARVLLNNFFDVLEAKRNGTSSLDAVLRFSHAEEIFPFAALLQLPGSRTQLPVGKLFTYQDDPFRGATVAPTAANIQWDLFRKGNRYLVRMLYDEKQTPFEPGCRPVTPGSDFYDLDSLESCYGYTPGS